MCGIAGIYNYRTGGPVDHKVLERMTRALVHRGPDGEGFHYDDADGIGFGHRRLTIIDLATGQQPMSNEKGELWITYNGEIYNFRALRRELETGGFKFRTNSDTEVLLSCFSAYGTDMFRRLNGIFAFGLWDRSEKKLIIARDHVGVKPLYFYDNGSVFVFASEIKAILEHPAYRKDIDLEGLDLHITFRHTPAPKTLFAGISRLPAGSYMVIDGTGAGKIRRHWIKDEFIDNARSASDWASLLGDRVDSAVTRQMVSDVPISLSLSGGIDSNMLLAILREKSRDPVPCFTIGFEDNARYDEVKVARRSAEHFGAQLCTGIIDSGDYRDLFSRYLWHLEEPLGNESALAYYFVAKLAQANRIKVLLNGQGSDELFGGYHRHIGERYRKAAGILPSPLSRALSRLVKNERLKRSLYALPEPDELERFFLIYSVFLPAEKKRLYNREMYRSVDPSGGKGYLAPFLGGFTNHSSLDKMLYIDLRFSLPDNLLLAEDKMAMAAGVEARVPYLDIDYVALAEQIPSTYKIRGFRFKDIHKKCAARWLPDEIIHRRKIGFTSPMTSWIAHELKNYFLELVGRPDSLTRRFFVHDHVRDLYERHRRGINDYKRHLFLILSLEQWYRTFFA